MDGQVVELELDDEAARVRRWRQEQLLKAGFSEFTAFRIAMRFHIPYQRAIELLKGGMPEKQVALELIDD